MKVLSTIGLLILAVILVYNAICASWAGSNSADHRVEYASQANLLSIAAFLSIATAIGIWLIPFLLRCSAAICKKLGLRHTTPDAQNVSAPHPSEDHRGEH